MDLEVMIQRSKSFRSELKISLANQQERIRYLATPPTPTSHTPTPPVNTILSSSHLSPPTAGLGDKGHGRGKGVVEGSGGALSDGELIDSTTPRRTKHTRTLSEGKQRQHVMNRFSVSSSDSDVIGLVSNDHPSSTVTGAAPSHKTSGGWLHRKSMKKKESERRQVSCQDIGGGDCKGWLWKKTEKVGLGLKKWLLCWVVLHTRKLYCFISREDTSAHSMVYLPGFCISPAPEVKRKQFAFKVHHTGTTFYFASETQPDMAKWMNKMALATLSNLNEDDNQSLSSVSQDGRSINSDVMSLRNGRDYDSESEESIDSRKTGSSVGCRSASPTSSCRSVSSGASSASKEDVTDLNMHLYRADIDITGTNIRERRVTVLRNETLRATGASSTVSDDISVASSDYMDQTQCQVILSLQRTLKDKERSVGAIETLLAAHLITSQLLRDFIEQHPTLLPSTEQISTTFYSTGNETPQIGANNSLLKYDSNDQRSRDSSTLTRDNSANPDLYNFKS